MSDKEPDILEDIDRGEEPSSMEPIVIPERSKHRGKLNDLAIELATKAAGFERSLPTQIKLTLANMVRTMNCYYSNLIEGHDTHPISAEKAMNNDYIDDPEKRNLQKEAVAHIGVQKWIDLGGLRKSTFKASSICEIHKRFYDLLPEDMHWVKNPDTGECIKVIPGEFRKKEVSVGKHIAISPASIPRFLERFEKVFEALGKAETIIASAAAHHRLLWIHPFLDGNGRVARLMSHAIFLDTLNTGGLWSISRGLAKNVKSYKSHLANCDLSRRNDLDGRGNLSEEALADFTRFFLEVCIDQVTFMESLMQPNVLRTRILAWAKDEISLGNLPTQSTQILEAILYRGELPRKEIPDLLGVSDRQARRIISPLIEKSVIISDSQRSPLYLKFPAYLASRWMPGLFPEE